MDIKNIIGANMTSIEDVSYVSIGVNDFVKRQTQNSRYSYFDDTWEELVRLVKLNWCFKKEGYRDGVILVPLPPTKFYTSMCEITKDSVFETKFVSRREDEEPIKRTSLKNGEKTRANFADIVLYRYDVLRENSEQTGDCEWEIISINASPIENIPMQAMTMARNMLNEEGGTKAEYTGQQFAESLWFWKDYCMYEGDEDDNEDTK